MNKAVHVGKQCAGNPRVASSQCCGDTGRVGGGIYASCKVMLVGIVASIMASLAYGYDWSQHAAGSTVSLPAGDTEVTDGDYASVAALASVVLSHKTSRIVFNLSDDHSASPLGCSIVGAGKIVKTGGGVLQFGAPHNTRTVSNEGWYDYFTTNGIEIVAGTLKFPQSSGSMNRYGHVVMSEGATLFAANDKESVVESLNGYGTVTNTATANTNFRIGNSPTTYTKSTFYGKIGGSKLQLRTDGYVELMNPSNTYGGNLMVLRNADAYPKDNRGITAVVTLGKTGQFSSSGVSSSIQIRYGGLLRYLGSGETCDKRLYTFANASTPVTFDAGATGGISWTGDFYMAEKADGRIVLTGDNSKECSWSGPWAQANAGYACYLAKEGSGTWRLGVNANRKNDGAWAVRNGTLKFDSLAERGEVCSFGLSTNLWTDAYRTSMGSRRAVDYAVLLGSGTASPVLEYSGDGLGVATNRPLRITGSGGTLLNNTVYGTVSWNDIAAEDAGEKVLTLAGANTTGNVAGNIADGAGTVSVVKTGIGTWRLEGNQTFSGSLAVNGGTLVVAEKPTQQGYPFYKLTVKSAKGQYLWIRRLALYDKDGHRVGMNLTEDVPVKDAMDGSFVSAWHFENDLVPGHVRYAMPSKFSYVAGNPAAKMLAEDETPLRTAMSNVIKTSAPSYWPTVIWRMPEGTKPVAAVDLEQHVVSTSDGRVRIFAISGSLDGKIWKELKEVDITDDTTAVGVWVSDGATITNNAVRAGAGWPVDGRVSSLPADAAYSVLTSVSGVSVAAGATLKAEGNVALRTLTVDCASGNGTIDGFDFAASGTINLVNLASDETEEVPISLANLPEGALGRLNDSGAWQLSVNGKVKLGWKATFTGSSVRIQRPGLLLIVR